jgi:hypothetical protein
MSKYEIKKRVEVGKKNVLTALNEEPNWRLAVKLQPFLFGTF